MCILSTPRVKTGIEGWPGPNSLAFPLSAQLSNYSLATFFQHAAQGVRAGGALYKDTVLLLKVHRVLAGRGRERSGEKF